MKYMATITSVLQLGIHKIGRLHDGQLCAEDLPQPTRVEIECEGADGPCFLLRYAANGEFCGDTWHETRGDALRQAEFEYGLSEQDFVAVKTSA